MLDPRPDQKTTRGPALVPRDVDRAAAPRLTPLLTVLPVAAPLGVVAGDYRTPLELLYERFDAVSSGRAHATGVDLHQVVLDRLQANRRHAEAAGWTACAFERDGGSGRLRAIGVAPSSDERSAIPDWTAGVEAEAVADHVVPPPMIVRG